jgi:hypothetical protein
MCCRVPREAVQERNVGRRGTFFREWDEWYVSDRCQVGIHGHSFKEISRGFLNLLDRRKEEEEMASVILLGLKRMSLVQRDKVAGFPGENRYSTVGYSRVGTVRRIRRLQLIR